MRITLIFFLTSLLPQIQSSSWFSSSGPPSAPSAWTSSSPDQNTFQQNLQSTFDSIQESTFDAWDESRIRQWLLDQGITVDAEGPREEIVSVAKKRLKEWEEAKNRFEESAESVMSRVSNAVHTFAAQATDEVYLKPMEETKDYVWSKWDESEMREYLVRKGLVDDRTVVGKKRDELVQFLKDEYESSDLGHVWEMWSDSYIHDWLASHNLIDTRTTTQKTRDEYLDLMRTYYYTSSQRVWDTWAESDMKSWLVRNQIITPEAAAKDQIGTEKLKRLIRDNYIFAKTTLSEAWSESDMRTWLVERGYLKSDEEVGKDELVRMFNDKYTTVSTTLAPYLVWPDARLRAYLREHHSLYSSFNSNSAPFNLPSSRSDLLRETRIKWIQSSDAAERFAERVREFWGGLLGKILGVMGWSGFGKEPEESTLKEKAYARVSGEM